MELSGRDAGAACLLQNSQGWIGGGIVGAIIHIGENFRKGLTRIGRVRLPTGIVAHLDSDGFRLAMRDLYDYSISGATDKIQYGIAFRLVEARERDGLNFKIQELLGVEDFATHSANFCPAVGLPHVIDSEHVAHAHHRHGEASAEREHGHFPITFADFERLPSLISPKNVDRFSMDRSSERIVYAKEFDGQLLIAVEELRKKTLILKTMYKQKLK